MKLRLRTLKSHGSTPRDFFFWTTAPAISQSSPNPPRLVFAEQQAAFRQKPFGSMEEQQDYACDEQDRAQKRKSTHKLTAAAPVWPRPSGGIDARARCVPGHSHEPGSLSCLSQPTATTSDSCNCSAPSPCVAPTLGLGAEWVGATGTTRGSRIPESANC